MQEEYRLSLQRYADQLREVQEQLGVSKKLLLVAWQNQDCQRSDVDALVAQAGQHLPLSPIHHTGGRGERDFPSPHRWEILLEDSPKKCDKYSSKRGPQERENIGGKDPVRGGKLVLQNRVGKAGDEEGDVVHGEECPSRRLRRAPEQRQRDSKTPSLPYFVEARSKSCDQESSEGADREFDSPQAREVMQNFLQQTTDVSPDEELSFEQVQQHPLWFLFFVCTSAKFRDTRKRSEEICTLTSPIPKDSYTILLPIVTMRITIRAGLCHLAREWLFRKAMHAHFS